MAVESTVCGGNTYKTLLDANGENTMCFDQDYEWKQIPNG